VYRSTRFTAWIKRKVSVNAFADKIKEKFGNGNSDCPIVILYGNWGKRPHLRHQAPTPGIGLRRLLHATEGITTITIHEAYTSSYCPNCHGTVEEARGSHGLLKCCDKQLCGTYWSRDVLGALNILEKGMHLLYREGPHPLFGG